MAAVWQRILANSALGAVLGGVVGGVIMEHNKMDQRDIRRPDRGEKLFEGAQENSYLLQLVVDLAALRDHEQAKKHFDAMHYKLGRLLHLDQNFASMPKRASWTEAAHMYAIDVRAECKKLVKHIVREMKADEKAYPNAMELVEALKKIATQAQDSAFNVEQNNLALFRP